MSANGAVGRHKLIREGPLFTVCSHGKSPIESQGPALSGVTPALDAQLGCASSAGQDGPPLYPEPTCSGESGAEKPRSVIDTVSGKRHERCCLFTHGIPPFGTASPFAPRMRRGVSAFSLTRRKSVMRAPQAHESSWSLLCTLLKLRNLTWRRGPQPCSQRGQRLRAKSAYRCSSPAGSFFANSQPRTRSSPDLRTQCGSTPIVCSHAPAS
jgi:hypothetical protein